MQSLKLHHKLFIHFLKTLMKKNSIMQLDDTHYSVCFEYQDISFAKANYEEQENIFLKWVEFFYIPLTITIIFK